MKTIGFVCLAAVWFAQTTRASDPGCPMYPPAERTDLHNSLELERLTSSYATRPNKVRLRSAIARANFIDNHIFGTMEKDGVAPAPLTSDAEFLRRVSLDLNGRIPSPDQAESFFSDPKRAALIEQLLASPAYTDQFTLFYANKFEVTSGYYSYIGLTGRSLFNKFLRDFVSRDRPFNQVATEMITATGNADQVAPANFLTRGYQDGDPVQDTWDTLTDRWDPLESTCRHASLSIL